MWEKPKIVPISLFWTKSGGLIGRLMDTEGLPTVPQNDSGGLNFKGLTSKYLLLMTLPPADDEKMKKNRTSGTPTSEKTSDSAFSSKVRSTKVKLKIRNSKN